MPSSLSITTLLAGISTLPAVLRAAPVTDSKNASTAAIDMPLTWTSSGFTTDIVTIGTPPQKVTCFTDWTWVGQYVISPLCHGVQDPSKCLPQGQGTWNFSKSTSFANESQVFGWKNASGVNEINWNPNHFFFYDDLSLQMGSDVERIGDSHEARIYIQVADMHFQLPEAFPFTGVFGLSPAFPTDNVTTQSAFYQMWRSNAIPSPLTSFIYCYNGTGAPPRSVCDGHDGVQTLGGVKQENVKGAIEWHDIIRFAPINSVDFVYSPSLLEYWAIPLTSMKIGDEEQSLNTSYHGQAAATFDHASYGVGAPMGVDGYNKLVKMLNGTRISLPKAARPNNGNQTDYAVDCSKTSSFPELKYSFGGSKREWVIRPENYVEKVNGSCVLNIRTLGEGPMQIGNFGKDFARDKVVTFDFEHYKVGISDLKW